jgi:hypothetical protein
MVGLIEKVKFLKGFRVEVVDYEDIGLCGHGFSLGVMKRIVRNRGAV